LKEIYKNKKILLDIRHQRKGAICMLKTSPTNGAKTILRICSNNLESLKILSLRKVKTETLLSFASRNQALQPQQNKLFITLLMTERL
jgi:hypothetical protein